MCSIDHPFKDEGVVVFTLAPSNTQIREFLLAGGGLWGHPGMLYPWDSVSLCLPAEGCACLSEVFWLAEGKSKEQGASFA